MRMLRMLMAWARKLPKVIEVCLAANDSLHPNWEALKPLYTRLGLKPCGAMYRTEIQ